MEIRRMNRSMLSLMLSIIISTIFMISVFMTTVFMFSVFCFCKLVFGIFEVLLVMSTNLLCKL